MHLDQKRTRIICSVDTSTQVRIILPHCRLSFFYFVRSTSLLFFPPTVFLFFSHSDGTPTYCQGAPRGLTIGFTCPADQSTLLPSTWTASNIPGTCDYIFDIATCAVCPSGCVSGGGFGSIFLIILLVVTLLYLFVGAVWNYNKGTRGAEMVTDLFVPIVAFFGYAMDGCRFAVSGCKSDGVAYSVSGGGNGSGKGTGGGGGGGASAALNSSSSDPYQEI